MRRLPITGLLAVAALLAAACSGSGTSSMASSGPRGVLTIDNETGGTWTCNFSPFSPFNISLSLGTVYEPLVFVNTLQNAKVSPWLATKWAFSNGNKTLTFTIRKGVKFTNGDPLTPADVVYTFNLLKAHRIMDINSVWSALSSVAQSGSDQVVMTFKAAGVPYFYYIADKIGIVDQKVWSKIAKPAMYPDNNPVGTGAFKVSAKTCTPQNIKYTANAHYWQPGLPKVGTVNYPAFLSNDTANTYLANGQAQWGSQFIPSIGKFLSPQPAMKWWFPPVANVSLFINQTNPILKNVAVRQAMAYAIDRHKASLIGEYGYEPASNQAGIVTPTFSSWLDAPQAATYGNNYSYNPQKGISILQAAGFKKGSDGIMAKGSQKLSFTVVNNGGFSDWVAAMQTIIQDFKAVGIQLTPDNVAYTTWQTDIYTGKFDLGYYGQTGGPSPYYELRQDLYSGNTAPIGTAAGSNFERYSNSATDQLINQYSTTTDPA